MCAYFIDEDSEGYRPTSRAWVLVSPHILKRIQWGHQPDWAKRTLFNSRADKIGTRAWSRAFRDSRCVLPIGGFIEWKEVAGRSLKQMMLVRRTQGRLGLAGLVKTDGDLNWASIITTESGPLVSTVHDREPVMLVEEQWDEYLRSEDPPTEMLRS
ncbi:MAG: SOS response-associated peptidase family protein, partial [Planctomycetota bacterium]